MNRRFNSWSLLVLALTAISATAQGSSAGLLRAAKDNDIAAVQRALALHANVNEAQGDGFTALHWAAYNDNPTLARLLLAHKAAPEARTRLEGVTPLMLAAQSGDTALTELLLSKGAGANTANDNGTTPLMEAALSGNADTVTALLHHGALVNVREKSYGQTALFFAAARNRSEALKVLIAHGADLEATTTVQKLERVSRGVNGDADEAKSEKGAGGVKTQSDAEQTNKTEAKKDEPGAKDKSDHDGKKKDEPDAYGFTKAERKAQVYGSLIMGGLTPLHVAARDGQIDAVRTLVSEHADINAQSTTDHTTALLLALINGHYDVARYLVEQNADLTLNSTDGLGPIYALLDVQWAPHTWYPQPVIAQEKTDYLTLLHLLLARHAPVNVRLTQKLWFRVFANDETWVEAAGATPFWRAALAGDLTAMKLLAADGADTNIASQSGDTPLMVAAGLGWAAYWTANAPASRLDAVKFCLAHGAKINTRDVKGYTAVHGAAFRGDNEMVHYLLAQGADIHVKSRQGDTVADSANGLFEHAVVHPDTVALLETLGSKSSDNCRSNECVVAAKEDKPVVGKSQTAGGKDQ